MKRNLFALSLLPMFVAGCTFEQPSPGCPMGHGDYAARYTLISGVGPCAAKKGESLGLARFTPPSGPPDPQGYAAPPDLSKIRLGIRAEALGAVADQDPDGKPAAVGDFVAAVPNDDGYCSVPTLSRAEVTPTLPAEPLAYQWSDVRLYQRPTLFGTQMSAMLEYTEGTCTATYGVVGVWPAVSCASDDVTPVADPAKCEDPESGLDPTFAVICDPDILLCVLEKEPVSLK
jgi:hypothetical protein